MAVKVAEQAVTASEEESEAEEAEAELGGQQKN